jgi:hypothetical protein
MSTSTITAPARDPIRRRGCCCSPSAAISTCLALPTRIDRRARFADPQPAAYGVKKPSMRYVTQHWFCQGGAVDTSSTRSTLIPEKTLKQP